MEIQKYYFEILVSRIKNLIFFLSKAVSSPSADHGLPLRGLAITLIGYTALGMTPLDERSA